MKNLSRCRAGSGVSLVEVLFAVGLLTVVLAALTTVFLGGLRLLRQAQEVATASSLARQEMEKIKERDYTGFPSTAVVYDGRAGDAPSGGFPPAPYPRQDLGKQYFLVVRSNPIDDKLQKVAVEIHWDVSKVQSLETILHR